MPPHASSASSYWKNGQTWIIIFLLSVIAALLYPSINKPIDKQKDTTEESQANNSLPVPEMVVIQAGSVGMTLIDPIIDKAGAQAYIVELKSFAISKNEVTFEQYDFYAKAVGKTLPEDHGWGRGNRPVINVSWHDAVAYTRWLSIQTGNSFRLPSEAEWEYAARAGRKTKYSWGDEIDCNKASYSIGGTCYYRSGNGDTSGPLPVGSYDANAFGLHDMHGNVAEWIRDCFISISKNDIKNKVIDTNGRARENCNYSTSNIDIRGIRGGAWNSEAEYLASADRHMVSRPEEKFSAVGFRIAQDVKPVN